jgi:hypothetical protein
MEVAMPTRRTVSFVVWGGLLFLGSGDPSWSQSAKASPDTVWVLLNHVKADQRTAFETFAYEHLMPAVEKVASSDPVVKRLRNHTRLLVPKEPNADGTYTYIWLMDPVVPEADYSYRGILSKVYSKERTDAALALVDGAMSGPQVGYVLAPSAVWRQPR